MFYHLPVATALMLPRFFELHFATLPLTISRKDPGLPLAFWSCFLERGRKINPQMPYMGLFQLSGACSRELAWRLHLCFYLYLGVVYICIYIYICFSITVDGRKSCTCWGWSFIPLCTGFLHPRWCRSSSIHSVKVNIEDRRRTATSSAFALQWLPAYWRQWAARDFGSTAGAGIGDWRCVLVDESGGGVPFTKLGNGAQSRGGWWL